MSLFLYWLHVFSVNILDKSNETEYYYMSFHSVFFFLFFYVAC